ncbi:MAG: dephospho-CoA kinase [Pseudoclavibacter sp.]|nr:dephospho-CoA kinase [Pseudoclavibacter sp.]
MTTIALTGGIASGKTTIARRLRELGAEILDADAFARRAVEPGGRGLRALVERYGERILLADGTLDRAALAEIIFGDARERECVNEILHPEIRRLTAERLAAIRQDDPEAIVVHDIPLLVEAHHNYDYDEIWVVDSPAELRIARLVEERGMDPAEARRRVEAQVSDEERRAFADVLIDSTQPLEQMLAEVDQLWARVARESLREGEEEHYDGTPRRGEESEGELAE